MNDNLFEKLKKYGSLISSEDLMDVMVVTDEELEEILKKFSHVPYLADFLYGLKRTRLFSCYDNVLIQSDGYSVYRKNGDGIILLSHKIQSDLYSHEIPKKLHDMFNLNIKEKIITLKESCYYRLSDRNAIESQSHYIYLSDKYSISKEKNNKYVIRDKTDEQKCIYEYIHRDPNILKTCEYSDICIVCVDDE